MTWTKPVAVTGLENCQTIAATVDGSSRIHVAGDCWTGQLSEIRAASSSDGGRTWKVATFAVPAHRTERGSQIAFDGATLYVAYSRLASTDGGCGDDGLTDVGVYVRSRQLPDGAWSEPVQIGSAHDELQSLRVVRGTVFATVTNDSDGRTYFETASTGGGAATARVKLANAPIGTSLRVGDDGVARIALEDPNGIRYGTADGGGLHAALIPSSARGFFPSLVLAPGNVADLLWTRTEPPGGCVSGEPKPDDGTYFSTNAGGTWSTTRITTSVDQKTLTVDPATGIVRAIVIPHMGMTLYERAADGTWSHATIDKGRFDSSPVLRQDPTTGRLVVAYVTETSETTGDSAVMVMTNG